MMKNKNEKKMVGFRLEADLLTDVQEWMDEQPVKPSLTAVVAAALRKFIGEAIKQEQGIE